jgi:hypothetical protein
VQCKTGAERTATAGSQGQAAGDTPTPRSSPTVQAPVVSIRMSPDLREQAEAYARPRRWSLAETTRVALEQLVTPPGCDCHDPALESDNGKHCARCGRNV